MSSNRRFPVKRQNLEREFLPAALEIIDTPPSPVGRIIGLGIIAMAVATIIWASIGEIDIVSTAQGHILPQGRTKVVQPLESGIVAGIRVADGDHVKAGDVLIELDATQPAADRDRFTRDLLRARLDLSRLQGLADEIAQPESPQSPDLVDPPQEASQAELALTRVAMLAQAEQQRAKLADLDQQIVAKTAETAQAQATIEKLQASLPMVEAQEQIRRELKEREFGNKLAWYQAAQQLIEETHSLAVEAKAKEVAAGAAGALKEHRAAAVAEYQVNILQELSKVKAQVSELMAELSKADERVRHAVLTAPIDGTVQQMAVHTIGGVVTPAEALLSVVPDHAGIVVEAMVENKDVGFVHAGQIARVKIDAFDFTRYGIVDGRVMDVTRDSVEGGAEGARKGGAPGVGGGEKAGGENANTAYIAHIALERDIIETETGPAPLGPGMQVSVEIQTGRRRVISYLLSPIAGHLAESMRER